MGAVSADYVGRTLRVEFDPALLESATVVRTLAETGFPGQPALAVVAPLETGAPPIRRSLIIAAGLLAAALIAWAFESWRYGVWLSGGLAVASTLVAIVADLRVIGSVALEQLLVGCRERRVIAAAGVPEQRHPMGRPRDSRELAPRGRRVEPMGRLAGRGVY